MNVTQADGHEERMREETTTTTKKKLPLPHFHLGLTLIQSPFLSLYVPSCVSTHVLSTGRQLVTKYFLDLEGLNREP